MKQLKEFKEMTGKTIARVAEGDDNLWIFFNDESLIVLRGNGYDDNHEIDIMEKSLDTTKDLYHSDIKELVKVEFISQQVGDALLKRKDDEYNAKLKAQKEASDRAEYERLKKKYEN